MIEKQYDYGGNFMIHTSAVICRAALVFALAATPAWAVELYVAPGDCDANTGAKTNPLATIIKARDEESNFLSVKHFHNQKDVFVLAVRIK